MCIVITKNNGVLHKGTPAPCSCNNTFQIEQILARVMARSATDKEVLEVQL